MSSNKWLVFGIILLTLLNKIFCKFFIEIFKAKYNPFSIISFSFRIASFSLFFSIVNNTYFGSPLDVLIYLRCCFKVSYLLLFSISSISYISICLYILSSSI